MRTMLVRLLLIFFLGCFVLGGVSLYFHQSTASYRYNQAQAVPAQRVAIIFGAGIRPNGQPSRILAERIQAAVELYQLGIVEKLLMTGDNSEVNYDEVTVMRDYAIARGVREEDITRDYAGFRTYDSCYRAKQIFGVEHAVLVTQSYHLPRAVYSCRQLGIEAVGLGTPDWGSYPDILILRYELREIAASLQALWELHITHPLPRFLGPFEGIS
jgi:vancomycin permeability regulator SanA